MRYILSTFDNTYKTDFFSQDDVLATEWAGHIAKGVFKEKKDITHLELHDQDHVKVAEFKR